MYFMLTAPMRMGFRFSVDGLRGANCCRFFAAQPKCLVALEACGGAHHWARELMRMGHDVRLIPPAYVKPFVKRQKNDANKTARIVWALLTKQEDYKAPVAMAI